MAYTISLQSRWLQASAVILGICLARSLVFPEDWPLLFKLQPFWFIGVLLVEAIGRYRDQPFLGALITLGFAWGSFRFAHMVEDVGFSFNASEIQVQCLESVDEEKNLFLIQVSGMMYPVRFHAVHQKLYPGYLYSMPISNFSALHCKGHEPGQFCFARWSWDHHQSITAFGRQSVTLVGKAPLPWIFNIRDAIKKKLRKRLNPRSLPWAVALVLGDKGGFKALEKQRLKDLGLMHVLAISGLHIGLFFQTMKKVTLLIPVGDRLRRCIDLLLLLSVWAYASICNLVPSVLRASLFLTWSLLGRVVFDRSTSANMVWPICIIIQLMLRPQDAFDMGFQLSYSATAVLYYVQPLYGKWGMVGSFILSAFLCAAISFPILLHSTQHFSLGFWIGSITLAPMLIAVIPILWLGLLLPLNTMGFENQFINWFLACWDFIGSNCHVQRFETVVSDHQAVLLECLFMYFFWSLPKLFSNLNTYKLDLTI